MNKALILDCCNIYIYKEYFSLLSHTTNMELSFQLKTFV